MAELVHADLGRSGYQPTLELQQRLVARVQADGEPSYVLLVEHDPPVITLGRRAAMENVLANADQLRAEGVELVKVRRGGDVTWHGPGQLVAYPILRLDTRRLTLRAYVHCLEQAVIDVLARLGLSGRRRDGLIGVWVDGQKVAAIGVAVSKWVTYHGLSLNVSADLGGFDAIVPCGIGDASVTSLSRLLDRDVSVEEVKPLLLKCLGHTLGFERLREDCGLRIADCGLDSANLSTDAKDRGQSEASAGAVARASRPCSDHGQDARGTHGQDAHATRKRLPRWLRKTIPAGPGGAEVRGLLSKLDLHTVCSSAQCPNQAECFARRTATFLILGDRCTRSCRFCAVAGGEPLAVDDAEADAVAEAAETLGLRHVVITSVTRDDLPDGGAGHFARVTSAVRRKLRESVIEILIPDFQGDERALAAALSGGCDILNHNVETVPRLYPTVRPQADYRRSLRVLDAARRLGGNGRTLYTKSGLMLGLGETRDELLEVFADLRAAGCDILTIGQYLAPSPRHRPVMRFVPPEEFDDIRDQVQRLGFSAVATGPFVRSSYNAEDVFNARRVGKSSPKG